MFSCHLAACALGFGGKPYKCLFCELRGQTVIKRVACSLSHPSEHSQEEIPPSTSAYRPIISIQPFSGQHFVNSQLDLETPLLEQFTESHQNQHQFNVIQETNHTVFIGTINQCTIMIFPFFHSFHLLKLHFCHFVYNPNSNKVGKLCRM